MKKLTTHEIVGRYITSLHKPDGTYQYPQYENFLLWFRKKKYDPARLKEANFFQLVGIYSVDYLNQRILKKGRNTQSFVQMLKMLEERLEREGSRTSSEPVQISYDWDRMTPENINKEHNEIEKAIK